MSKRIIISGGGTGGHIFPAIAIANALKAKDPQTEILFVGANGRMEMEKVPQAGYPIFGLDIAGINRSNLLANLSFPAKLTKSLWAARKVIRDFKPDAAVGVGGYASGPLLLMAGMNGVPYLIQEQNSYAGITNKFLAQNARKICVAYPDMQAFFPTEKVVITGNPVRSDIGSVSASDPKVWEYFKGLSPDIPTLLVIGGSQGARTINESIDAGLEQLLASGYQIIWQTGKLYIDKARQRVSALHSNRIWVSDFINQMPYAYAAASVVISRAGALSISELCLVGKPSIFVPLPTAAEDHQTKNAMALVREEAGLLVKDAEAREKLIPTTLELFKSKEVQQSMGRQIQQLAKPQAAQQIAEEVWKLSQ
ncbi:undecaprenyldiphospho-muramoylpentapeptide beta-N-acetylglucosaminyltransferase [Siphonobacter curvatus]|uniref:UDP-N-acetylglucosamine--N-acetylmuramyl-(pentapeptide) pyrophosphoryl-undecaprenol N-acetylglucosamine transferase n=1 Tax=Siphonobacter curvatus TaxID=2094562 RepID=A0A2S7IKG9_9BACT|nr:undecaprenyldiphospho-muramoylpentapeptide beta-N-acetylglucosaminyltransferase [Siphonobacter curvatus]PQA58156.1 undecaprenyldiphospho-muramoylpentapeptide beta-N-acetylglucosaminyltransferase [Siphonobacter curvatus]